jgi:hypothetical protein
MAAVFVQVEVEQGSETHTTKHANGIFSKTKIGIPDAPDDPFPEIFDPPHVVDHGEIGQIVEKGIDRKVPPESILPGSSERIVGHDGSVLHVELGNSAESGDLDNLSAAEVDMGQPEAPSYETAVSEQLFYLVGMSGCAYVKVLGSTSQEKVSNAATYQVGGMPVTVEAIKYFEGIGIDEGTGDAVFPSWNDTWIKVGWRC